MNYANNPLIDILVAVLGLAGGWLVISLLAWKSWPIKPNSIYGVIFFELAAILATIWFLGKFYLAPARFDPKTFSGAIVLCGTFAIAILLGHLFAVIVRRQRDSKANEAAKSKS